MFLLVVALSVYAVLIIRARSRSKRRLPLPPGPPADPLIGHLRRMPQKDAEEVFMKWAQTYGDIMHLSLPGRSIVVLSSVEVTNDILERRSANYSDRPYFPIYDLLGWSDMLTLLPYGKRFQRHRKIFQDEFSRKAVAAYEPLQSRSAHQLVNLLLTRPDDLYESLLRYTVSISIQIIYGHEISSDGDWLFQLAKENGDAVPNTGPPGGTPVDLLPILKYMPSWFPGTHYASFARKHRYIADGWTEKPYVMMQESMARGERLPFCFMTQQLDSYDPTGPDAKTELSNIKSTCSAAFAAGAETTWSSLLMFMLAMVLHPKYQKMAQEEIELVVGSDRLPALSDRGQLPIVEAVLQEVVRWQPVVPLGVPHSSLEDDVYKDMFIPKGSVIITNIRAMSLDERVYSDPHTFNPMRFLPRPEGNGEPHFGAGFGFGRRICPGRHIADTNLWVAISTMLATLNISAFKDIDGIEQMPVVDLVNGLTCHPKPFKCKVEARNEKVRNLIDQTLAWDV